MPTFTPPTVTDNPPILPETTGAALGLFHHYTSRARGVNVFKLSDGTYVQDTGTTENENSSVPYPWDINWEMGPGIFSYTYDPVTRTVTTAGNNPYIVSVYYGGHTYTVSAAEAAALTSAGYGGDIT